jgi:hypothetical protein
LSQVVKPETILRWHRFGFKAFWRWKSRNRAGRPKIDRELRDLIRRMCRENPLWGAPGIHGELLMLGFDVAQSTISKYMVRLSYQGKRSSSRQPTTNSRPNLTTYGPGSTPTGNRWSETFVADALLMWCGGKEQQCPLSANSGRRIVSRCLLCRWSVRRNQ